MRLPSWKTAPIKSLILTDTPCSSLQPFLQGSLPPPDPTCLCWCCPCVSSPWTSSTLSPRLVEAAGMRPLDGVHSSTVHPPTPPAGIICSLPVLFLGRRNLRLVQMFKHTSLLNYSVCSACSWSSFKGRAVSTALTFTVERRCQREHQHLPALCSPPAPALGSPGTAVLHLI